MVCPIFLLDRMFHQVSPLMRYVNCVDEEFPVGAVRFQEELLQNFSFMDL